MARETLFTMDTSSIKYGPGATRELGYDMRRLGAGRVMVVTDLHLARGETVGVALDALRGIHGIAMGGMMPTANALIADMTEPETRGAVYGLTSAASSFGNAVGPLGGATIGAQFGLRAVFPVTSVVLLFISAWVARTLGRAPAPAGAGGYRTA